MKYIALFTYSIMHLFPTPYLHLLYHLSISFLTHAATESNQAAVCRMLTVPFYFCFLPTELSGHTVHTEVPFLSNSPQCHFPLTASFASLFSLHTNRPVFWSFLAFESVQSVFQRPVHAETQLRAQTRRHDMYIYPIAYPRYKGVTL